jgi:hypothetical protein
MKSVTALMTSHNIVKPNDILECKISVQKGAPNRSHGVEVSTAAAFGATDALHPGAAAAPVTSAVPRSSKLSVCVFPNVLTNPAQPERGTLAAEGAIGPSAF